MIFKNLKVRKDFVKKIKALNLKGYNKNISYCGLWAGNGYRSKLKIHKILPFNRFCYLHDNGYHLLTQLFPKLTFKEYLYYKFLIDEIFHQNMLKGSKKTKNIIVRNYKKIVDRSFFTIVGLCTPIYYVGTWWKCRRAKK